MLNKIIESIPIVLSLHPRTKDIISRNNLKIKFLILEPIGYLDMIELIKHSSFVMTDTGALQTEAFFLKKNCVILRDKTKWTELTKLCYNKLSGANERKIINSVKMMLKKESDFSVNFLGNGNASKIIVDSIKSDFKS